MRALFRWFIRFGVWIVLAFAVTFWEISAYLWDRDERPQWYDHPTISKIVKKFETRGGLAAGALVATSLIWVFAYLMLHWVARVI